MRDLSFALEAFEFLEFRGVKTDVGKVRKLEGNRLLKTRGNIQFAVENLLNEYQIP